MFGRLFSDTPHDSTREPKWGIRTGKINHFRFPTDSVSDDIGLYDGVSGHPDRGTGIRERLLQLGLQVWGIFGVL